MQLRNPILQSLASGKNISLYLSTHTPLELKPEKRFRKNFWEKSCPRNFRNLYENYILLNYILLNCGLLWSNWIFTE